MEDLSLGRIAALVPEFAVKDLPLGRTLVMMMILTMNYLYRYKQYDVNKTKQETPFSEQTIKFRPHIIYNFFGPFNRPRRLLKGWHLFPFHPVHRR